ncbi:MAG TPA: endonuclease III [Thermoplasmata archaeon]|nr:endonuclease III [Thermoplasmata archaeon]
MTKRAETFPWEAVLDRLTAFYHAGDWRVPYLRDHAENPFQVLIGTILSQRTRDENTDRASAALFAEFPDAASLSQAPLSRLERLLRPVGFYRTKSRNIRACAAEILDRFGGVVPHELEPLLSLPGVGHKTANCVLVFGYGIPAIPVDTHVHRISNRLGLVRTEDPDATEEKLRAYVPEQYWNPLNPLLVQHGQNLCRPLNPLCPGCPILEFCPTGLARRDGRATPRPEDRLRPSRRRNERAPRGDGPSDPRRKRPTARRTAGPRTRGLRRSGR